jgi:hypothetical protein
VPTGSKPVVDLVLGLGLLATIGFAATRGRLSSEAPNRSLGWLLIALPLPTVVAFRLTLPSSPLGSQAAFVASVLAFAAGAALILGSQDDADDAGGQADPDPAPWWPEFEREFRAYAQRQSRPRVRV